MDLIAYDPYANPSLCAAASVTLKGSLDELLTAADFFTIHTPLIASTKGMISSAELAKMKPTARILNVARGGMIDEVALLEALEAGTIAGAGIDVFTSEPPTADSTAARLIAHPKVVATPHLGASTREAQENVSIDVCEQVILILSGALPRSAVNAPLILPEEYRTLAPFVQLVERMGSFYTQHYGSSVHSTGKDFRTTFDLTYEGSLANLNTTKPLFAALVKGLISPISSPEDINVNIVNAELVAKERGILINEQRSREHVEEEGLSSFVTLRARSSRSSSLPPTPSTDGKPPRDQIIQGYVSGGQPYISRLGRFRADFVLDGNLLLCRNFDSPGKIGTVGSVLGKAGVNIKFMSVAPLEFGAPDHGDGEALMILKVDSVPSSKVMKELVSEEGVLETSIVSL
jgi:D-3-phosphoglycerate dehydrogenase